MATISAQEFLKGGQPKLISSNTQTPSSETSLSFFDKAKQVGTGVIKGALDTTIGTTQLLQKAGQAGIAAIDPTMTYSEVRDKTGFKSLQGAEAEQINKQLEAKTGYEKAGKALEFVAEILYPVGKAEEVANLTNKASKTVGATFDGIGSRLSSIGDDVVEGGVKVKDKIGDMLVNLDQKTKTALDRTPKEVFQSFVEKGKQALTDDRIRTPLEAVGDSVIDGLKYVKNLASEVGAKKSEMIKLPSAFEGKGISEFKGKIQSFLNSKSLMETDKGIVKNIVEEFKRLGDTPTKGQVDKFIDYAQNVLYAGEKNLTLPASNEITARLRGLIGGLNNSLKSQMPEAYRAVNDQYGKLTSFANELNTKLGKKGQTAGSLIKRLFSPSDARTKELFDELQRITGVDYFRDARLAKFVMESLGDTRAASLLEQIPTSAKGAINKLIDYGINKLQNPIKAGERYIDNAIKAPITNTSSRIMDESVTKTKGFVEKAIDYFKSIPNKQGGFVNIKGKEFKEIPEATKKEMVGVLNYINLDKPFDKKMEDTIMRLAEKYNIPQDWSSNKIADAIEKLVERTKTSN